MPSPERQHDRLPPLPAIPYGRAYFKGIEIVAYRGAAEYFVFHTEQELAKGYADIVLEPLVARYPGMRYGFVVELKYLNRAREPEARVTAVADEAVG